tara:strand:- start:1035 stop:1700 length:666 start_codon:yes stop_codon:yes gene_type:complete
MPDLYSLAQLVLIWAVPILLAVTIHEVAHGLAAQRLGDDTAARAGRLSLNPLKHVDPMGTVVLPAMLMLMKLPPFGWAKPVPVNFSRLNSPRRDMAIVAAAGPASNLVMALIWVSLLWLHLKLAQPAQALSLFGEMCVLGVQINLVLMILNLLPVPPLDGGRIAVGLLPPRPARILAGLDRYTMFILIGFMALAATGVLGKIIFWPVIAAQTFLFRLFGLY